MTYLGKKVQRLDGEQKVSGKAIFGNDLHIPGMLYAACRHSDITCGMITELDISAAQEISGVKAIALFKDIPGQPNVGPVRQDYLPLVDKEIFFRGDVIAAIAAESRQDALKAAAAIKLGYQPYEPLTDPRTAIKSDARSVHPQYKSNIVNHYPLRKGNIKIGFDIADKILSRSFATGFQEHAYIEPETVTVAPDPESSGFNIYGSIQNPYTTRKVVALFMGMPLNRINVIPSTLGGSFGGKDDIINNIACRTALLCQLSGKPVQMTYTREESFIESYKRHPYYLDYKIGFSSEGEITAAQIKIIADSGAYSSQSFFVTWRSLVQAAGPYQIPHVEIDITSVYTNNSYTAAFRGFGSPQVIFAQESIMDEIAQHCDISPVQVRLINGFDQDCLTSSNQKLNQHTVSLKQVINTAVKAADFTAQREKFISLNETSQRYKKGMGLACSYRGCSLGAEGTDTSSAIVSVQADGSIILITGVTENGQGLKTTMSMIAAETLGVPLDDIVFLSPQTSAIADGGPTVASRGTLAGGNAVRNAARIVKSALFELIKEKLKAERLEDTSWCDGLITSKNNPDTVLSINFKDAVAQAVQSGINLSAYGWFKAPAVSWQEETGQGDAYFTYVYGCQIAQITVDTYTGAVSVDKVWAVHDLGKVINLLGAQGQVYGGVVQGIGYACLENFNISQGKVLSANFDTYLIPTSADIPEITPIFIENPDASGPFGAKSLGEPAFELIAAAVNNALFNAVSKNSTSLPLSLEQVFLGHDLQKPRRQSLAHCEISENQPEAAVYELNTITPKNLPEALSKLAEGNFQILAGGTDKIISLRQNGGKHNLIKITQLPELKVIKLSDNMLHIGSCVTFAQLIENPLINQYFPVLAAACRQIGSTQIRNIATIGGNITNAAPCADSLPPLIFYDAYLKLLSLEGERKISAADFVVKSYNTQIKNSELLTNIQLSLPGPGMYYYHYFQLGRRKALNITRLSMCLSLGFDKQNKIEHCRLAAGSLLAIPALLPEIEELIINRWIDKKLIRDLKFRIPAVLQKEIGKRWSAPYKIPVFTNLVIAGLEDIQIQYNESQND